MAAQLVSTWGTDSPKRHRIFLWRSRSVDDLRADVARFRDTAAERSWTVRVDRAENDGRADGLIHRLAVVADGPADLDEKLATTIRRLERANGGFSFPQGMHYRIHPGPPGKVAFMFPGQGAHRVGMVDGLSRLYPDADSIWVAADGFLDDRLDQRLSTYVFPPPTEAESALLALAETHVAQPAIGAANWVVHHVLTDLGVRADMYVGHSYGELVALAAGGALSFAELVRLSETRGRAIGRACRGREGAMLALGADQDAAERLVSTCNGVVVANVNAPEQTVVSGPKPEIDDLCQRCADEGIRATKLDVATAFHSPLIRAAEGPFRRDLDAISFSSPHVPVYANTTAEPYPADPEAMRACLVDHLTMPVRFMDGILNMQRDGARVFVEVGPGTTLAGLAGSILKQQDVLVTSVDHRDGLFGLLNALARLFVAGVPWSMERLRERVLNRVPEKTGDTAGSAVRSVGAESSERRLPDVDRTERAWNVDVAMRRHQKLMKQFVESEAKVMIRYLRSDDAPAPTPPEEVEPLEVRGAARTAADRAVDTPVLDVLRSLVASLTGYPVELLDPDLDLESDLGIDSIKRMEILAEFMRRSSSHTTTEDETRVFSRLATLAQMAAHLDGASAGTSPSQGVYSDDRGDPAERSEGAITELDGEHGPQATRQAIRWRDASTAATDRRRDGLVVVGGLKADSGEAFSATLVAAWPRLSTIAFDKLPKDAHIKDVAGYVHLGTFGSPSTVTELRQSADIVRDDLLGMVSNLQALEGPLRESRGFVVVMTGPVPGASDPDANPLAGGHVGALKSVAHEWPEVDCRALEVPRGADGAKLADLLASELRVFADKCVEVSYRSGRRQTPVLQATGIEARAAEDQVRLDHNDVILVTGGGRGITAEVARALAEHCRPVLVVVGRTVPTGEPERYRDLSDAAELKREIARALRESGESAAAPSVAAAYKTIMRQRELAANLRRLREFAAETHYMVADAADSGSVGRMVDDVYRKFGRIDGVIHGAGVIEDRLIGDKDLRSFQHVMRPKADGALALVGSLKLDQLKFIGFFSSTAAVLGNAGQCDYAAANGVLNWLARWLSLRTPARVLSMIWGPWEAGVGMVDDLLARRFEARGIPLVDRQQGSAAFLEELRRGSKEDVEVVFG